MVGRDHTGAGVPRDILAIDVIDDRVVAAKFEDQALVRAFAAGIAQAAGTAQDRRHVAGRRDLLRQLGAGEHGLAIFLQTLFGERDHLDHALVRFARLRTEGEDAVLVEDQALDLSVLVEHLGSFFSQAEAGHQIGHEAKPPCENFRAKRLGVRLIDQAQQHGRMGVVDGFRRHEGVQQHFDRRGGRLRIDQKSALYVRHLVVGQRSARAQLAQRL